MTFILGCVGLFFIYYRLKKKEAPTSSAAVSLPLISVIIPARNEEHRLPELLESLSKIKNLPLEIIVVNDQSTDKTSDIAKSFGCKIVEAPERPTDWTGKSWACHYGSTFAEGELLLFTDADTRFHEGGLTKFIDFHMHRHLDMSCPMIFHKSASWWESLIGVFHMLYLIGTNYNGPAATKRLYANGQCLLFRKDFYVENSHFEVKEDLAEDMALAKRCIQSGGSYDVYSSELVYDVQMFANFKEFYEGWHRIFRLGLRHTSVQASLEVALVIIALLGCGKWLFSLPELLLVLASSVLVYLKQGQFGEFRWYGVFVIPVSVALFTCISLHALLSNLSQSSYSWRGRSYTSTKT